MDVAADENPHFTHLHTNLSLIVFPDSNWYISVVLLYVIVAGVRSNKRYSNPVTHWILAIRVPVFVLHDNMGDVIKIYYVVVNMKFLFGIENTLWLNRNTA